jgi:hypothetical protein
VKVSARHGRLHLRLEPTEVSLLESLFAELAAVVSQDEGSDDPVVSRLFPAAYAEDAGAEAEFRSLTQPSLRTERIERTAMCTGELSRGRDVDLGDPEAGERWIKALNDLRLALGTRLAVTEEDYEHAPTDEPWVIYHWLTAVQDSVVTALMR